MMKFSIILLTLIQTAQWFVMRELYRAIRHLQDLKLAELDEEISKLEEEEA